MAEPLARVYELGLRALDEQERSVSDVRSRLPPVLAAGGVAATLLARPVFAGRHPHGVGEIVALIAGLLGAAVLVAAAVVLLRPTRMAFSVDAELLLEAAREARVLDSEDEFHEATAGALAERRRANEPIVERLTLMLEIALIGLVLELVGLGTAAALAS